MKIKTLLPLFIVHDQHFKEYFRIMRISLFMLFVCIFQLMATNTEAQNAIMKLETNVISIGQLINQIEKQTDYLVVFRNREVDTERTIRIQEKSGTNLPTNTFCYLKRIIPMPLMITNS